MSEKHLERKEVLNLVYTQQADAMANAYARLKAEVELWKLRSDNWQKFCELTRPEMTDELTRLKAEVERLTNQKALATPRHLIASQDIKTLREQIEELKLENSQYEEHHKYGQNVITSLREEVERLTKAGDELIHGLAPGGSEYSMNENIERWNAAKEGKQPNG